MIFHIFRVLSRCSKYDFWNLWKFSDWHEKKVFEKNIFWNEKKKLERKKYLFFSGKFRTFSKNVEIFNMKINLAYWKKSNIFGNFQNFPEKINIFFVQDFFSFQKNIVRKKYFSCQSEIFQRFQKSHLESHLMPASARKMQNPKNSTQNYQIWYCVMYNYP